MKGERCSFDVKGKDTYPQEGFKDIKVSSRQT